LDKFENRNTSTVVVTKLLRLCYMYFRYEVFMQSSHIRSANSKNTYTHFFVHISLMYFIVVKALCSHQIEED
jgi:hypothetical protein